MAKMETRFLERLKNNAEAVEAALVQVLDGKTLAGEILRPQRLLQAMRHATLGGGKRIRPFLVIECAALFGVERNTTLSVCAALECLHTYSLVHDDLPAMDDDELRRGKPTLHIAFDEATAILAGDALLTLAFDILASDRADPGIRIKLVLLLARAAGIGGMVGGQMLDLAAETNAPNIAGIRTMQAMKTGALIRFACEAGAILGKANDDDLARMAEFGALAGRLFQLADDILDVEGNETKLGKKTAKDMNKNKATLVAHMGIDKAHGQLDQLLDETIAILEPWGERADILRDAARFIANRDH